MEIHKRLNRETKLKQLVQIQFRGQTQRHKECIDLIARTVLLHFGPFFFFNTEDIVGLEEFL